MSELVNINGTDMKVTEYKGERVVTLTQIDAVHGRPDGTARRTFNEHKHRLVEEEDFFEIDQPDAIRSLGIYRPQGGTPGKVILLSEQGYTMLVKPFSDDLAWKVQGQVVRGYFRKSRFAPISRLEILHIALESERARIEAEAQRDEAIRTKAEIGCRREATAMNRASQALRRADRLELELDRAKDYATIKRVAMLYHGTLFDWRRLKRTCVEMGIPPTQVFDVNYGTVNAYHARVWQHAYAVSIHQDVSA